MKTLPLAAILLALSCVLSGCANESEPPPMPVVSDSAFSGQALAVVVEQNVSRKNPGKSKLVSEAVRNYLRDALEESITARKVFAVVGVAAGPAENANLAHVSASIISVTRKAITFNAGPFVSTQEATVDAKMEVRLTQPGQADIVTSGKSSVPKSANAVIVAARQFKDWIPDDSWASVACKEALQKACDELADKIEPKQRALASPSAALEHQP